MTTAEINALEVGLQLDEAVAVHVFGYERFGGGRYSYRDEYGERRTSPIPQYSAKWGEAELVVEQMRKAHGFAKASGNGFTLMHTGDSSGWYCEFPLPRWESADASTAPEAICRAALKAECEPL